MGNLIAATHCHTLNTGIVQSLKSTPLYDSNKNEFEPVIVLFYTMDQRTLLDWCSPECIYKLAG